MKAYQFGIEKYQTGITNFIRAHINLV